MKSSFALATLALATTIGAPAPVFAGDVADYVFNVPVSISKLGPGHRAEVQCRTAGPGGSGGLTAHASTTVPLDGTGNYSGTLQVRIPAGNFAPSHYECDLIVDGAAPQGPRGAAMRANGSL